MKQKYTLLILHNKLEHVTYVYTLISLDTTIIFANDQENLDWQ